MILNNLLPIKVMQKINIAQNLVTSHALTIKKLLNFSKGLPSYGKLFTRFFGFRETIMQMSPRCKGDFTSNLSVVVQISKRQDLCPVSLNPTTLGLSLAKVTSRQHELSYFCDIFKKAKFSFKIAAPGEGRKPSCEEYIAESEFALLSILSKQCLMIHFYLDAGGQH